MKITVKDITIIALFAAVLFVQEQLLSFLPNIQMTMLLIMVYTRVFKIPKTTIIVLIHVILDNLINGSFNIVFVLTMFLGWENVVIVTGTVLKNNDNTLVLSLYSILFTVIYCLLFAVSATLFFDTSFIAYITNDILFTIIMCVSSFVSVLWLFIPLTKVLNKKILKEDI